MSEPTTTRCQPGDLALVIAGPSRNLGVVVRCLELLPARFQRDDLPPIAHQEIDSDGSGPLWRIDRPIYWAPVPLYPPAAYCQFAPDDALMPLRPGASLSLAVGETCQHLGTKGGRDSEDEPAHRSNDCFRLRHA